ncbi:MAG: GLUG motif-containing protein, partial [Lachnospiraceae bacterium]
MKIQKSAALFSLLPAGALAATLLQPFPVLAAGSPYAGGSGTAEDPWQIETAEEFSAIREHLDGNFVLTADIDLSGMGNFDPIGTFTPGGEDPEQADESTAFTGTLDGQGHTVTGLTCIQGEDRTGTGLFGAVSGDAMLTDFTLGDVTVVGGFGTGALAGYISGDAVVDNVDLTGENNRVLASTMVGGLVGAANNEVIRNCDGEANVGITGTNEIFAQCAGVLLGGVEGADVENCHVSGGTVTAFGELVNDTGINGLGGLAGCVMSTDHLTDSSAANVSIRANEDAMLIGGLTGFSGNAEGGMT